jgi:hypothetical protein
MCTSIVRSSATSPPRPGSRSRSCVREKTTPAEEGADPRDELTRAERFRDVVVGPEVQTLDALVLETTRRQENDWRVGVLADSPTDLESAGPGEHDVEDQEVESPIPGELEPAGAGRRHRSPVSIVAQVERHEIGGLSVILDDEDLRGLGRGSVHAHESREHRAPL